jgi:phosphatidylglycerol lysyltransferase
LAWVLAGRLAGMDGGAIGRAATSPGAGQWAAALALTALSFAAVAAYDLVAARGLALPHRRGATLAAGAAATALAQMAGLGVLTGTLARWRLGPPGAGPGRAAALTAAVTAGFFVGWLPLASAGALLLPGAGGALRWAGAAGLALCAGLAVLAVLRPRLILAGRRVPMPGLPLLAALTGLAALDTLAAAAALWVLLPPGLGIAPLALYAAFLAALAAGMAGGAPGGAGAFELTLLALLAPAAPEGLIGGVLAFRLVYHVLPAVPALGLLARGAMSAPPAPALDARLLRPGPGGGPPPGTAGLLGRAARGEAGLLRQGDKLAVLDAPGAQGWVAAEEGSCLVALGHPLAAGCPARALALLETAARERFLWPVLYRTGPIMAAAARARGWRVVRIGAEAVVDPAAHGTGGPARRELRRKLRRAAGAGVTVVVPAGEGAALPLAEMAAVSARWAAARGGERGFSTGVFAPGYVAGQRVLLARWRGRLVGFVTLSEGAGEWALDLMRLAPGAPDGTMHLLVHRAIRAARADGVARLSLAAAPFAGASGPAAWLGRYLARRHGSDGLYRFKQSFRPAWRPRYMAAPGAGALALGALAVARRVAPRRGQPVTCSTQAPFWVSQTRPSAQDITDFSA